MTNGRALVLGDPGPWMLAGMTGGVVYLRHDSSLGLTEQALKEESQKEQMLHCNQLVKWCARCKRVITRLYPCIK